MRGQGTGDADVCAENDGASLPAPLDRFASMLPSRTPFNVLVRALDAFGNVSPGYTGTVHFTSADPRTPDPDDHRATRIALTAEGAALLHALRRRTTDALARRIDDLTADRRAALVAALPVLEQIALPD